MTVLSGVATSLQDQLRRVSGASSGGPGLQLDPWLAGLLLTLTAFGSLMITSASLEFSAAQYGNSLAIVVRHAVYLTLGAVVFLAISRIPLTFWYRWSGALLLLGIAGLVLVFVPGLGREVNGSSRWIDLRIMTVQPSEAMKIALIVYVAGYLVRRREEVRTRYRGFLKPLAVVSIVTMLLLAQPDFGSVVILTATLMAMMFLGGVRPGQFFATVIVAGITTALMAVNQTYRVQRLLSFLDPWAEENVYGASYQLTQSLIAVGRGEWFGAGLGNSLQKLFYLPEAHTDFIMAIVAEELGLVGALVVIALYAGLLIRIGVIGRRAEQSEHPFAAYLCFGVLLVLGLQTFTNIGVSIGLLPTKGLTLPFLSYGGSSLLVSFAMLGLVARAALEARPGGATERAGEGTV